MFLKGEGDWQKFKGPSYVLEIDLHFGRGEPGSFDENMGEVENIVISALRDAQDCGFQYVKFVHGHSTSGPSKTSARSVVRGIMRDKESTPFIIKSQSIQHESVFMAAVRPKEGATSPIIVNHDEKEYKLWRTTAGSFIGFIGQKYRGAVCLKDEEEVFSFFGEGRLAMELYEKAGLET